MNKKMKLRLGYGIAALTLAGFAISVARASDTQAIPFTSHVVTGSGCPSTYYGYAKMTNDVGSIWLTPPMGTVSGTFTNMSSFTCDTSVTRKSDLMSWCGTNSVTFPATNSTSYQLIVYVCEPGATNGQPITVQVNWQ